MAIEPFEVESVVNKEVGEFGLRIDRPSNEALLLTIIFYHGGAHCLFNVDTYDSH